MNGTDIADRVQGRLDRLELTPEAASRKVRLPSGVIRDVLAGSGLPRGTRLQKLAEALECSVAYLAGLDPDAPPPSDLLAEDQANFGLLAGDEEALLAAYRGLDVSSKAALLRVVQKMAEPKSPS